MTENTSLLRSAVYGTPPPELADVPAGAIQTSPLRPGAMLLEDLAGAGLDEIVMAAPPGSIERRYTLALALQALGPGGRLTALAPKDKGGDKGYANKANRRARAVSSRSSRKGQRERQARLLRQGHL